MNSRYNPLLIRFAALILLLSSAEQIHSQEAISIDEIRQKVDNAFHNFSREAVPTGILSDYTAFEPIPLSAYDGVLRDSNYTDLSVQALLYTALGGSLFDENKKTGINFTNYMTRSRESTENSLSLLLYRYNYIPQEIARKELMLNSNNQLESKSLLRSQQRTLYSERLVVAMAPKQIIWDDLSIQYHFPNDAIYSNLQEEITSYAVQYDKGLPFTPFAPGGTLKHTYASEGVKHLVFRIALKDGQQLYSQTNILLQLPRLELRSTMLDNRLSETIDIPETGKHAGGRLIVSYSKANTKRMENPIIIAEGYDLSSLFPSMNSDLEGFLEMFYESEKSDLPRSLEETTDKFDIIYLDYSDGMDNIWRNVELMKDAIRKVNEMKVGNEKNIVVGYSMGGLIAAAALRQMELASEDHKTWKYISLDAPHHGATIPVAVLAMLEHFSNHALLKTITNKLLKSLPEKAKEMGIELQASDLSLNKLNQILNKPATKQLLINNFSQHQTWHSSFFQQYFELGLPKNTTNIAFSNGAMGGAALFEPGSNIFDLDAFLKAGLMSSFIIRMYISSILGIPQVIAIPLNLVLGSMQVNFDLELNALGYKKPIYLLDIHYRSQLLGFIPAPWTIPLVYQCVDSSPLHTQIEGVTGGYYAIPENQFSGEGVNHSNDAPGIIKFLVYDYGLKAGLKVDKISFVPRNSALYLKGWTKSLYSTLQRDSLVKQGQTPFHRVYGILGNKPQSHMDMSAHNKAFDLELKEYPAPARIPLSIVGPSAFKDSAVYYIPEMHKGVHYSISSGPETLCEELEGGHKIRVTPRTDGDPSMIGRKTWVGCTAKKICSPDSTERTFRMPVYMGTPHPDDIEIKQLSMSFSMGDAPVQSTLLPAVIVLWKGAGELLDAQFQNSDRVSEIGIINSISAFAQEGYVDTLGLNGEGLALIGAYNVDPSDLSLRNNTRFMSGQEGEGSNTDLDISTGGEHPANPSNPSRPHPAELELAPPEVLPIFPPRDLEYLNVHSFYLFAPLPALVGTPTAGTAPPETINLRVKLTNQAGKGDWTKPFAFQVPKELIFLTRPLPEATPHPGGDLRPILVPSVLQDGLGTLRATSSDASSPNVWEGIKVKVELFSDTERVFSTEAMTNETVNLSALARGNYTVLFTVGTQRFSQTISIR